MIKDEERQKKIIEHLSKKWNGQACTMCKTGNWSVSDTIFELREYNDGNMVIGNVPIFPVIPITCDNCGNSLMINAIVAGIDLKQNEDN